MQDIDPSAAKVARFECTREPKCYDHPSNLNIKFWDLPGITNLIYNGDLEKYCKNVPLDKYHTFLIFAKDRFTADDLKLAEMIRSTGKKFSSFAQELINWYNIFPNIFCLLSRSAYD